MGLEVYHGMRDTMNNIQPTLELVLSFRHAQSPLAPLCVLPVCTTWRQFLCMDCLPHPFGTPVYTTRGQFICRDYLPPPFGTLLYTTSHQLMHMDYLRPPFGTPICTTWHRFMFMDCPPPPPPSLALLCVLPRASSCVRTVSVLSAFSGVPRRGDKIFSVYITRAFSGPTSGRNATSPLLSRGSLEEEPQG